MNEPDNPGSPKYWTRSPFAFALGAFLFLTLNATFAFFLEEWIVTFDTDKNEFWFKPGLLPPVLFLGILIFVFTWALNLIVKRTRGIKDEADNTAETPRQFIIMPVSIGGLKVQKDHEELQQAEKELNSICDPIERLNHLIQVSDTLYETTEKLWNWGSNLKVLRYHLPVVEKIYLVVSSESKSEGEALKALMDECLDPSEKPRIEIWEQEVNFYKHRSVEKEFIAISNKHKESQVAIDVTSGTVAVSIAGITAATDTRIINTYVEPGRGRVLTFDFTSQGDGNS